MSMNDQVKPGGVFGRWTALEYQPHKDKKGWTIHGWFCRCSCGTEKWVLTYSLVSGASKSCGCYSREVASVRSRTHGMSKTHAYKSYNCMMSRCYNKNHRAYRYYGGRKDCPIGVCEQWHNIDNFLKDAVLLPGYDPYASNLTLDRIDPDKDYCPENCRWVSNYAQQNNKRNNRRVMWRGESKTIAEIARMENLNYNSLFSIWSRMEGKMSIEEIVDRVRNKRGYNIAEIARGFSIPYMKLYHQHVTRNLPIDKAIAEARKLIS